jgi:hypothetical protein
MTRPIIAALLVAALSLGAAPIDAQVNRARDPIPSDTTPLSLEEAIARAIGQSQEVRLARAEAQRSDEERGDDGTGHRW